MRGGIVPVSLRIVDDVAAVRFGQVIGKSQEGRVRDMGADVMNILIAGIETVHTEADGERSLNGRAGNLEFVICLRVVRDGGVCVTD